MDFHYRRLMKAKAELSRLRSMEGKAVTDTGRAGWYQVASGPSLVPTFGGNDYGQEQLAKMYSKHGLILACVREIATSISQAPIQVGREIEGEFENNPNHPMLDLFYGSKFLTYPALIELMMSRMLLTGATFNYIDQFQIIPIPSQYVRMNSAGIALTGYEVRTGDTVQRFEPEEIMGIGFRDPACYLGYTSILRSVIPEYEIDGERIDSTSEYMRNRNVPGLIIKPDRPATSDQLDQAKRNSDAAIGGSTGSRGRTFVVPYGWTTDGGAELKDINYEMLNNLTETRICMAFGVPPQLLGARSGQSTYANYEQASKSFVSETLLPMWRMLQESFSHFFFAGSNEAFRFDLSEVKELQEDLDNVFSRATQAYKEEVITRNEARAMMGFDPIEGEEGGFRARPEPIVMQSQTEADDEEEDMPEGKRYSGKKPLPKAPAAIGPMPGELQLEEAIKVEFAKQKAAALEKLNAGRHIDMAEIGAGMAGVMEAAMVDIIEDTIKSTARKLSMRVNGIAVDAEVEGTFNLVQPGIEKRFKDSYIKLSEETLATTQKQLDATISQLRQSLVDAGVRGPNTQKALTEGVQRVFEHAENWRARRIAVTEYNRALNDARFMTDASSGMVAGYVPLISPDACEICQQYDENNEPTGLPVHGFTKIDDALGMVGKYDNRTLPPYHPHCRCSVMEVYADEEIPNTEGMVQESEGERPPETPRRRPGGRPEPAEPLSTMINRAVDEATGE